LRGFGPSWRAADIIRKCVGQSVARSSRAMSVGVAEALSGATQYGAATMRVAIRRFSLSGWPHL